MGFIGKNKLVDIVRFAETAYNETWEAKIGWEKANLRDLEKERTSLEELKKQAEEEGDKSTAIKLRDKIILLNDQIRNSRAKLYLLELDSLRDDIESYEERLKEISEDKERLLEAFPNKLKPKDFQNIFSELEEDKRVEVPVNVSMDPNLPDIQMYPQTREGLGNIGDFLKLDKEEQKNKLNIFKKSLDELGDDAIKRIFSLKFEETLLVYNMQSMEGMKVLQENVLEGRTSKSFK